MKYAVIYEYTSDKENIQTHRPEHRQYLMRLRDAGHLVAAGPFTDDSGSLIVYEAESADEVIKIMQDDPFAKHGVFANHIIRPWNPVLANRELLPAK